MQALLDIAEGSIELLEKAAKEADALEAQNQQMRARLKALEGQYAQLQKSASQPAFKHNALLKLAKVLEDEEMLVEGQTAEKLAGVLAADPNQLVELTLSLIRPVAPQGLSTKAASTESPGDKNVVEFEGRKVVDHDGWVNVIR